MTDKDKIVEIILNTDVTERAADRIADDLIENGIGDVTEWKCRAEKAEQDVAEWKRRTKRAEQNVTEWKLYAKALSTKLQEV